MTIVMTTPFGSNAQDLLAEDRHKIVVAGTFATDKEAVAWINAQTWPTDYWLTWPEDDVG